MFYCFVQNNPGGVTKVDDRVTHYVIMEADSAKQANDIAEYNGIYFDGCYDGIDCRCCGDRWYRASESDGKEIPKIYGQHVKDYDKKYIPKGETYAHVYYADGRKESFC